jgi:hypothetical protein
VAHGTYTFGVEYTLGLVDWLQNSLVVTDVTLVSGRIAAVMALGAVAVRIAVIYREWVHSGLNTRAPLVGGRVARGTVIVAEIVHPFVTIATNVSKTHKLGP